MRSTAFGTVAEKAHSQQARKNNINQKPPCHFQRTHRITAADWQMVRITEVDPVSTEVSRAVSA